MSEILNTRNPEEIKRLSLDCLKDNLFHPGFYAKYVFEFEPERILAMSYMPGVGWAQILRYGWKEEVIGSVYVRPDHRRHGHGTRLFDSIKKEWGCIPAVKSGTEEGSLFFKKYFLASPVGV